LDGVDVVEPGVGVGAAVFCGGGSNLPFDVAVGVEDVFAFGVVEEGVAHR